MSASLVRVSAEAKLREAFLGRGIGPSRNRAMLALLKANPKLERFCFCDDDMVFGFDEFKLVQDAISLEVSPMAKEFKVTSTPSNLCNYIGDTFYGGWDETKNDILWKKSHMVTTDLIGYFNWNPSLGGASLELLHEIKRFLHRAATHDSYAMRSQEIDIFNQHNFFNDMIPNIGGNCFRLSDTANLLPWACRPLLSGYLFQQNFGRKTNALVSSTMALSSEFILNYPFELLPRFEEVAAVNAKKELNWRKGFPLNVHLPMIDYAEGKLAQKIVEEFFSLQKLSNEGNKISLAEIIDNLHNIGKLLDEMLELLDKQKWMNQSIISELKFIFSSLKKEMNFAIEKIQIYKPEAALELDYSQVKEVWQKIADSETQASNVRMSVSK